MNKKIIIGLIIGIVLLVILFSFLFVNTYKPFSWDGEKCITYYKDCTCVGLLKVMKSYPPKYDCQGLEFCKEINVVECE